MQPRTILHATARHTPVPLSRTWSVISVMSAVVVAVACSDTSSPNNETIELSAQQAAALAAQMQTISTADPDLAWLADSATVVVQAGTVAKKITMSVDASPQTYYAVGLQRAFVTANSFATFHLIAFDDPSNAHAFVILNGYRSTAGSTPPTSVTGVFGGDAVFGHIITVSGQTATDWVAQQGAAAFALGSIGAACGSLPVPQGASCVRADLVASANINVASAGLAVTHSAVLDTVAVPGVLLTFEQ